MEWGGTPNPALTTCPPKIQLKTQHNLSARSLRGGTHNGGGPVGGTRWHPDAWLLLPPAPGGMQGVPQPSQLWGLCPAVGSSP